MISFIEKSFAYEVKQRIEDKLMIDERSLYGGSIDGKDIYLMQYTPRDVPEILHRKFSSYLRLMNLEYGAFDVVLNSTGEYIFLECNPEGQWYAASGFNIADVVNTFAEAIERRLREASHDAS